MGLQVELVTGEFCQKQENMLPVYIIQLASFSCSDGDVLMEAVVTKARIEAFTKHGYFQVV